MDISNVQETPGPGIGCMGSMPIMLNYQET